MMNEITMFEKGAINEISPNVQKIMGTVNSCAESDVYKSVIIYSFISASLDVGICVCGAAEGFRAQTIMPNVAKNDRKEILFSSLRETPILK